MPEKLKSGISENVRSLNQEQTNFLIDEKGNPIGALIIHLTATEA
ncbi:hypothetical protein [Pelagihabitans pacificus]|nr:hypothetical protein [Pelagihabitans pacificus]